MPLKSLRGKLLLYVSAFVVGSGFLISVLMAQRYSTSLFETMLAQGENIAHAVSLAAADEVLINDMVSLQKVLDHHVRSHPSVAYLFILRNGEILAHTFPDGVPIDLIEANHLTSEGEQQVRRIVSTNHERYLDISWPVFEGKAGTLRLGLSEAPYLNKIRDLWIHMSFLTSVILILALVGVMLFVRRVTNPLRELARATERIDCGDLGVRIKESGNDEVGRLAGSFNRMAARVQEHTRSLEMKASELERANQQTRAFCHVIQRIGSLRGLDQIGSYLIHQFRTMFTNAGRMVLVLQSTNKNAFFLLSEGGMKVVEEEKQARDLLDWFRGIKEPIIKLKNRTLLPQGIWTEPGCTLVPVQDEVEIFGALLVQYREGVEFEDNDLDALSMILGQSAGVMRRAILDVEEAKDSRQRFDASSEFSGMIGKAPQMHAIYKMIEEIAPTDTTVLIQGESGTGKEMVARAIHSLSGRREKPFVVIDCSAYPETLLESELFGHEKGSFTGAVRQKAGRFEQADGGTVFLDEIGEIPSSAQIKLLRVIQTQKFERIGGEKTLSVNIRILAATNKELLQQVKKGRFREDLYYRLNVIPILMPPLRERRNDIPLIARFFLRRFTAEQKRVIDDFSPEAMRVLLNYAWPGNVRELENSVEHATVLAKGSRVEVSDLPCALSESGRTGPVCDRLSFPSIAESEKELLMGALEKFGWNKKEVARRLGISRNTLYQKLKRHNLFRPSTH